MFHFAIESVAFPAVLLSVYSYMISFQEAFAIMAVSGTPLNDKTTLVLGAGPAGLTAAYELARSKHGPVIVKTYLPQEGT